MHSKELKNNVELLKTAKGGKSSASKKINPIEKSGHEDRKSESHNK